jgi:hypothetical protein
MGESSAIVFGDSVSALEALAPWPVCRPLAAPAAAGRLLHALRMVAPSTDKERRSYFTTRSVARICRVMATILEITSVYLDDQQCGGVTCPECGVTRVVNLARYKGEFGGKVFKVKCAACATVVHVRFDFRRHHRAAMQLSGALLQCGTKHALASVTITSLSVSGVGFTLCTPLPLQSGEHYDLIFFLDDADHTLIFETIVIRRVQDREVGVDFCLEEPYHSALDFYLMDAFLDPAEA